MKLFQNCGFLAPDRQLGGMGRGQGVDPARVVQPVGERVVGGEDAGRRHRTSFAGFIRLSMAS